MSSGIYVFQNTMSGKRYVGSAVSFTARWARHLSDLRRGVHPNQYLQKSFVKHGEAAFEFKVVEECPKDALLEREQYWLDSYKPEYNIAKSAAAPMAGRKHSAETIAKMSAAAFGNKRGLGRKRSPEAIAKTAAAQKGRIVSPETRAKISAAKAGRSCKKPSPETRAKMSAASAGRKHSVETRANMSVTRIGRKHSAATRVKISLAARSRKRSSSS